MAKNSRKNNAEDIPKEYGQCAPIKPVVKEGTLFTLAETGFYAGEKDPADFKSYFQAEGQFEDIRQGALKSLNLNSAHDHCDYIFGIATAPEETKITPSKDGKTNESVPTERYLAREKVEVNWENVLDMVDGSCSQIGANLSCDELKDCRQKVFTSIYNNKILNCLARHAVASVSGFDAEVASQQSVAVPGVGGGLTISCSKIGPDTTDYKSCKQAMMLLSAGNIAEVGMETTQNQMMTSLTQKEQMALQTEEAQNDLHNKAIESQQKTLTKESQNAMQKGTLHSTKASTLSGVLASWTTPNNLMKKCSKDYQGCCNYAMENLGDLSGRFFPNAAMRQVLTSVVAGELQKAAAEYAQHVLLKKKAELLDKYKINGEDTSSGGYEDYMAEYCQTDQGKADPQCNQNGPRDPSNPNYVNPGFNFNSGVAGNFGSINGVEDIPNDASGVASTKLKNADKIKSTLSDWEDSPGGSEFESGASRAKKGSAAGGGGGATRSSVSASGGGGPSGLGGGESQGSSDGGGVKGIGNTGDYKSKAARRKGWSRYKNKKEASGDGNVFSGLFANAGKESRSLAETQDIVSEGSDLFKSIHKRYTIVESEDRLMNIKNQ